MQSLLKKMLLLAVMLVPLVTMGQGFDYSCDFEDDSEASAWTYVNGSQPNKWVRGTAVHNGTGTHSLYISSDATGANHSYTTGTSVVFAYKTLTLSEGAYEYSYDWMCNGEKFSSGTTYDYMRVALVPNSVTMTAGAWGGFTETSLPSGGIPLDDGEALVWATSWTTNAGTFQITNAGDYKLVVFWENDYSGTNNPPAAVDNFMISIPSCPSPMNFMVNNVVGDQATLSWSGSSESVSYTVEYGIEGDTVNPTLIETAYDTTITLSGLEGNTIYAVNITANCGAEESHTLHGTFRSACSEITIPYTYSFEDVAINEFPECWFKITNNGVQKVMKDGQSALKFFNDGIAATPHIPLAGNNISIKFSLQREGTSSGSMQVGFVTDLSDISNMVVLTTITPDDNAVTEYEVNSFVVGADAIDEGYIVFKHLKNSNNWYYWLSNVTIDVLPDCPTPANLVVSDRQSEEITLAWAGATTISSYTVEYGAANDTTNQTNIEVVYEPTITLTGLEANTLYNVTIVPDCGTAEENALTGSFKTSCGEITLPYSYSFEDVASSAFPDCWFNINQSNLQKTTKNNASTLRFSSNAILATPHIPLAGNMITLTFSLQREGTSSGTMSVGFVTNLLDVDSMAILTTIDPSDNDVYEYEINTASLGEEYGEEGYIVFKQNAVSMNWYYWLSDVTIAQMSNCIRPESMTATNITYNSATLSWAEVTDGFEYDVMYGTENDPESEMNTLLTNIAETSIDIADLSSATTYYIWVRHNCGDEYSAWRSGGEFTTQVACAQVRNVEVLNVTTSGIALSWEVNESVGAPATEFELRYKSATDADYTSVTTTNPYYILTDLQSGTVYEIKLRTICTADTAAEYVLHATTSACGVVVGENSTEVHNYVPINAWFRFSYSQLLYTSAELANIGSTITSFAFDLACNKTGVRTWDVYMGHTSQSTLTSDTKIPIDNMTLVASNVSVNLSEGWCFVNLTTPFIYNNDSNLVIAIDDNTDAIIDNNTNFHVHAGSSLYKYNDYNNPSPSDSTLSMSSLSYVPNIMFTTPCEEGICEAPLLVISDISTSTVSLTWDEVAGNSYQVEYKLRDADTWTVENTNLTDNTITISNLQPGSFYEFRVGNNCTDTIMYTMVEGFTDCAAISAPYTENFNSGEINPCWILGNLENTTYRPTISTSSMYMSYGSNTFFILPEFTDDIASLHALFSIESFTANSSIVVAVGSDVYNVNSYVAIDTFTVADNETDTPMLKECNFSNYTGDGHFIAFLCPTGKVYIDDLTIETLPSCSYPSNITISEVTGESATVSWSGDNRMTNNWIVRYHVIGDTNNIMQEVVASSEMSHSLIGLQSNTPYEVIVLNICGEDTVAALSSVTFRTECAEIVLPYMETFEHEVVNTFHPCWYTTNAHSYGDYYTMSSAPLVVKLYNADNQVMKFSDNVNMISPRVPIEGNRILLNFDSQAESMYYTGKLVVGFSTTPTDSAMIVIDTITYTNSAWNNYEYVFSDINTTDTGYIVFKNIDNEPLYDYDYDEYFYYDGYIDNVLITVNNNCSRVTNIAISNITGNSATITFNDSTSTGDYTIGYATTNDINNITDSIDITGLTHTLTGLQPNTRYYVWVRNNCTMGVSPWTAGGTFKTPCDIMTTLPYIENFDGYTTDVSTSTSTPSTYPAHAMPDCWDFINMSSTNNTYPQSFISGSTAYAHSGNCLFMKSSRERSLYAILPQFSTPVNDLTISFKYRNEGESAYNGVLELGVMSNINDTSTFTVLRTMEQTSSISTITHNFSFDELSESVNYTIAFRYVGGTSNNYYLSIDEIIIDHAPACPAPEDLSIAGITSNSVTLSWNGSANSYKIQYRNATDTNNAWIDAPDVTTTTTTINGLTSDTEYEARVKSVCDTLSEWTEVLSFKTLCGSVSIPYTEDFDSYTQDIATSTSAPSTYPNHAMPNCWTFPGLTENNPKIFLSSQSRYRVTGNSLFFISSSQKYAYAVLPLMDEAIDTLSVNFTYINESSYSSNSPVAVGVMTNPMDTSTFRELEVYPIIDALTNAEHCFSTDTGFVDGTDYYIAFRYGHNTNMYYFGLDNVSVDYAPTCPKLQEPTINNITSNSADISWSGNSPNYEVSYKGQSETTWTSQMTTSTMVTLNNLNANSVYMVRVRAYCTATDTSEWSETVIFETECGVSDLPFMENFTASGNDIYDLTCWERYKGTLSDVQSGSAQLVSTTSGWNSYSSDLYPVNGGEYNAYIDIYGTGINYWLVSPMINISSANVSLKFDMASRDWNGSTDYSDDDKFVVLATADSGATWVVLQTWQDTSYENIPNYALGFDSVDISLSQFNNQIIRLAFYGESTVSGGDHYLHIDNIEVASTTPSCNTPTDLSVNNLTATSATLSWHGSASAYDVEYREQDDDEWTSTTISETTLAIGDLDPLTAYEWRVRGNCGDVIGNSAWVNSTFTTLELPCPMPTNVTATAEGNAITVDWTANEDQSEWEVIVYNLDTITETTDEHPVTIEGLLGATTYQVQVRALCSDEVHSEWTAAIEATTASCGLVTNVTANNITENAATITWNAAGSETEWEINYGDAGFAQGQGEVVEANTTSYTLSDLESEMSYDVYVRAVCGDSFYGLWSNKITFETLAGDEPEGIDGVDGSFNFVIYPNPTNGATTISLNGVEGQITISVIDINGRAVMSENIECGSDCEKRVDVTGLAQGTYFVRVLGDNINSVRKLIVR